MKKLLFILIALTSFGAFSQTGNLQGNIQDKEYAGNPLPFTDVYVKGTTKGSSTDFDGNYTIQGVPAGTHTIVVSFVGYETKEIPNVIIKSGETTFLNTELGADANALKEVIITAAPKVKETESALIEEQKEAVVIIESIGAQQLSKQAVSDAAAATSKISGVTKTEGSGDVFIRGLGDRYLSTTLNGLPVPSDDVERKNIDLGLFPTNIIQNVGISKTYDPSKSGDQASGNVDIATKIHSGQTKFSISASAGANYNVVEKDIYNNFKQSQNSKNTNLGFYSSDLTTKEALVNESWNTTTKKAPINAGISASLGKSFFGNKLSVFTTVSHSQSYSERIGTFADYNANVVNDTIFDAQRYSSKINSTGLLSLEYKINGSHRVRGNAVLINKGEDQVNEFGRDGNGAFFEETPIADGASQFVRDQNYKQTKIAIYQLHSDHRLSDKDNLELAVGYNFIDSQEPNRIRNEVNIYGDNDIRFGNTGGYQQRKTAQTIIDEEYNAYIKYKRIFVDNDEFTLKGNFGYNFRNKERKFDSRFDGLAITRANITFNTPSFDNLDAALNEENILLGVFNLQDGISAFYDGELLSNAGYGSFEFQYKILSLNIGARYENTELNLPIWDVPNQSSSINSSFNTYENVLPSLTAKVNITDQIVVKTALSKTVTLPEFKELAPFEYVAPNGRVTRGNPELNSSENLNGDLKFEYYPKQGELMSVTAFGKIINDPINTARTRGSSGVFSYFNTSEKAEIIGLEIELRKDLFNIDDQAKMSANFNLTRMWHKQDLKGADNANGQNEEFRYGSKTSTGVQGASDWIVNGSLTFSNNKEKEFLATVTGNYSSDKILALGSANEAINFDTQYNNEIIEKGFVTLDMVLSKKFNDHLTVKLVNKNLVDPEVKQTQIIDTENSSTEETVLSYKKGRSISLGINYTF